MSVPEEDGEREGELSIAARRRAIFDRARERYRLRGTPIDDDPAFVALMEAWIGGRMEMGELARMSAPIRRSGSKSLHAAPPSGSDLRQLSQDELLTELDRIIGLKQL